jgi:hypothetical protein
MLCGNVTWIYDGDGGACKKCAAKGLHPAGWSHRDLVQTEKKD